MTTAKRNARAFSTPNIEEKKNHMSHKTGRRIPRKNQVVVQTRKLGSTRFDIISDNGLFAVQVYENDKLSATIAPFPSLDKASSALKKHMQELKLMAP